MTAPDATAIEKDILRMIVGQMSDSEIAFALGIDNATLRKQIARLEEKLGTGDRATLGQKALESGFVADNL